MIICTLASSANRSSVSRSCVRAFLIDTASRSRSTFDRRSSSPGACRSANITDFAYSSASLPLRPNASATHLPNSRFRRAFSLNRNSCSSRNFSSDPFFRSSNMAMIRSPVEVNLCKQGASTRWPSVLLNRVSLHATRGIVIGSSTR